MSVAGGVSRPGSGALVYITMGMCWTELDTPRHKIRVFGRSLLIYTGLKGKQCKLEDISESPPDFALFTGIHSKKLISGNYRQVIGPVRGNSNPCKIREMDTAPLQRQTEHQASGMGSVRDSLY